MFRKQNKIVAFFKDFTLIENILILVNVIGSIAIFVFAMVSAKNNVTQDKNITILYICAVANLVGAVTNTMCWLLIAKRKSSNFLWCIVASVCSGYIALTDENVGQTILNIGWYIPTSLFGFVLWQKYKKQNKKSIIEATKFKLSLDLILVGIIIVCCALMTYVETLTGFIKFWNPESKYVDPTVPRDFIFYFKAFCDASSLMIAIFAMVLLLMRNRLQYPLWIGVESLTVALWIATWILNGKSSMADSIQGIWSHTMSIVLDVYGHILWNKKKVKKDVIEGHMILAEQDLKSK